jgi:hypothetical protein
MSTEELAALGFVHIPKNGGTSIVQAIRDQDLPIRVSGHAYPRRLAREEIVVLRDPLTRFASAFRYCRLKWRNPVNDAFADANDLAESAADPDHPKHATAMVELGNLREHYLLRNGRADIKPHTVAGATLRRTYVYEPQSTWLLNSPAHLLRYPVLERDFSALLERLGLSLAQPLPRLNASDAVPERYSALARGFLEELYRDDLAFIESRGLDV